MDTRPPAAGPAADPAPSPPPGAPEVATPPGRPLGLVAADEQDRTGLWVVLVAGFVLRFWNLGAQSLWTDEGTAWTAATLPLRELIDFCLHKDASPPLYYLLTGLAMKFGGSEAHLRAVSAIASSLLVWVTYRFARLWTGRRIATVAAALLAFSPYQLMYAQEARTYALVALWVVAGQYLFARAILLDRPRAWVPWILVSALGLYTQSIALLGVLAQGAFALLSTAGRRNFGRFALGQGIAAALYLPWFVLGLSGSHLDSSHWYLENPAVHSTFQVLRAVFLSPISLVTPPEPSTMPGLDAILPRPLAWALLLAPLMAALALALPRLRDPGHRGLLARFVFAAIALPLLAVFLLSLRRPLWLPRYFVFLGPMVAMALALGVSALPRRWASMALAAALLVTSAYGSFRVSAEYTKERWRDVAKLVAARSDPANTAVIVTFDPDPFLYYNAKLAKPFRVFAAAHPDVPFHDRYTNGQLGEIYRALRDSTERYEDVWVVVRSPNSEVRRRVASLAMYVARDPRHFRWGESLDSLDSVQGKLRFGRFRRGAGWGARRITVPEAWMDSVPGIDSWTPPPAPGSVRDPFTMAELVVNRDTVAHYLGMLPKPGFVSHFGDRDRPTGWRLAAERLGTLGPGIVPTLVGLTQSSDQDLRLLAMTALAHAVRESSVVVRVGWIGVSEPTLGIDDDRAATRRWWSKHRHFWDDAR